MSTASGAAGGESVFADRARRVSWPRREARLLNLVDEAVARATEDLPVRVAAREGAADVSRAIELVSTLTWAAIEHLHDHKRLDPDTLLRIGTLVADLQDLADQLYGHEIARREDRLAVCEAGLARLHAMRTTADLTDRVCTEVSRCAGFQRVVLSRVDDGVWTPWKNHFTLPGEVGDWFDKWVESAIHLDDVTLESDLLLERRPALVREPERDPRAHPIVIDGRSPGYVVAPINPGGDVVGFLHADFYPTSRTISEVDRDILWMFAVGFGQIYERTLMLERLEAQREQVRNAMAAAAGIMDDFCNGELELSTRAGEGGADPTSLGAELPVDPVGLDKLTPREREVLRLIAAGAVNKAIAASLVITEGTVKSHVKHILRKLGVANRSQAVASYLGSGRAA